MTGAAGASRWQWPLLTELRLLPDAPGLFGAPRRHDRHTGVDLYCEVGTEVRAVEAGVVVAVEDFTGPKAEDPSPWWLDTQAALVEGASGVVVYGEIAPKVRVGERIEAGQRIGTVKTVLPQFKGRPQVMLHLELLVTGTRKTVWWRDERPAVLLDPTPFLLETGAVRWFERETYDGRQFRDPERFRRQDNVTKIR